MSALYDRIGVHYQNLRKPDPRIGNHIADALGNAGRVLNVGAGTGSYEPADREVIAVEPSREMILKRHTTHANVVQASALHLPFDDRHFDASMAVLTVHHWADKDRGLRELRRVTKGRIVILTFDPMVRPWLTNYLPELAALDEKQMPALSDYAGWLGETRISAVPIPHDCSDGFLYAYWRRPTAYLDPKIRSGSSSFWALKDVDSGLRKLRQDLDSGEWARRYTDLLTMDEYDAGYRLVVAEQVSGEA